MIPEEKVNAVREYFRAEFPAKIIKDRFEESLQVHLFYLSGKSKGVVLRRRFLETNSVSRILKHLGKTHLSRLLKQGSSQILVGNDGKLIIL